MLQKAGLEALFGAGSLISHDARKKPHDRVEYDLRRSLAAGQDIVADGDLFEVARLDDAFIDAFEAAANDHHAVAGCQFAHALLRQRRSARRHQQAWAGITPR